MKVIVVSHGGFSKGVVDSVQMLTGEQKDFIAYSLLPEQTVTDLTEQLREELEKTPEGEEVIFLTDIIITLHAKKSNPILENLHNIFQNKDCFLVTLHSLLICSNVISCCYFSCFSIFIVHEDR